ncbi:putative cytochrome P450 [Medicago truncatula]|uniref:Putative cytochrome P450 n=1 Tax=Medicago truncatula TaxID=3880 RepID=A0A396H8U3_MEDTR|nr:putative cytochrome P450 [Medicago truncatula]
MQKWLQIGEEKKMTEACKVFDKFLFSCIASKREELKQNCNKNEINVESDDAHHVDLLTTLIREEKNKDSESESIIDKFLRDAAFNLFVAGRDTITSALTWLFYLVATHPLVEAKIVRRALPMCVRFRRLFNLAENKSNTVSVMCGLGWEEGGAAWQW